MNTLPRPPDAVDSGSRPSSASRRVSNRVRSRSRPGPKNFAQSTWVHVVEGVLSEEVLSEKDARHYAEDAGKSKAEIAKIKGDQRELGFEATGVLAPKK